MFLLHRFFLEAIVGLFFYLGICILNGIGNGWFFLLSAGVLLLNFLITCIYIRAERETFWWSLEKAAVYFKQLDDDIKGLDTVVAFGKTN